MTNINEIKSVNWQLSRTGFGDIAEGLEDIRQCLYNIWTTTRGTDPLRPEFGTLIYQYLDKPVLFAAPKIVSELLDSTRLWETRVLVKKIVHEIDNNGGIMFRIYIDVLAYGESKELLFKIDKITRPTAPDFSAFAHGFSLAFA